MELNITLEEKDFLEHQLYSASKSPNIRKQRRKVFIYMIIICVIATSLIYFLTDNFPTFLVIFYTLFLLLYTFFQKKRYINHYKRYISENYKERFGMNAKLIFTENRLVEESKLGESKVNYESLSEINEIKDYHFLKLITGGCYIIPKREIDNITELKTVLNKLKNQYNIKENIDLNWKWK